MSNQTDERTELTKSKQLDVLLRTLSSYGPKHIAKVLSSNTVVRRVRLDGFNLGDDGILVY